MSHFGIALRHWRRFVHLGLPSRRVGDLGESVLLIRLIPRLIITDRYRRHDASILRSSHDPNFEVGYWAVIFFGLTDDGEPESLVDFNLCHNITLVIPHWGEKSSLA